MRFRGMAEPGQRIIIRVFAFESLYDALNTVCPDIPFEQPVIPRQQLPAHRRHIPSGVARAAYRAVPLLGIHPHRLGIGRQRLPETDFREPACCEPSTFYTNPFALTGNL